MLCWISCTGIWIHISTIYIFVSICTYSVPLMCSHGLLVSAVSSLSLRTCLLFHWKYAKEKGTVNIVIH